MSLVTEVINTYGPWLQGHLGTSARYQHSLEVAKQAETLAIALDATQVEQQYAVTAGLLHDCAKLMPHTALLDYCQTYNINLSPEDSASPQILHALVGADRVQRELGIHTPEVINAIRYHTTGRAHMHPIEQWVYIADKWVGLARFPESLAPLDAILQRLITIPANTPNRPSCQTALLQDAMTLLLGQTVAHLTHQSMAIHPDTLLALSSYATAP